MNLLRETSLHEQKNSWWYFTKIYTALHYTFIFTDKMTINCPLSVTNNQNKSQHVKLKFTTSAATYTRRFRLDRRPWGRRLKMQSLATFFNSHSRFQKNRRYTLWPLQTELQNASAIIIDAKCLYDERNSDFPFSQVLNETLKAASCTNGHITLAQFLTPNRHHSSWPAQSLQLSFHTLVCFHGRAGRPRC